MVQMVPRTPAPTHWLGVGRRRTTGRTLPRSVAAWTPLTTSSAGDSAPHSARAPGPAAVS
eukprot:16449424-Heterocapsa_arctica.AAC.1